MGGLAGGGGGCTGNSMNARESKNSNAAAAAAAAPVHVLAVDDNLIERKLLERLLKNVSTSCTVTTAENGMKALEYLGLDDQQQDHSTITTTNAAIIQQQQQKQVDLIITDYCMPGMTGYQLLKRIKESKVLKEVPVVVMSSENIPTRVNQCLKEGAEMFMLKPLKQADVNKLIMTTHKC
ncbi:unnamed protein product [Linum tenue]|uniref:Response regulatory domain-containing protein n=1 Tax=Linum tenue TaxID=586396 RepID=A0AAV0R466_9ROSI|nr:unnamed protein product [Linum tenue]